MVNADLNCVRLPEAVSYDAAAALGCRFMTAWHAVQHQAKLRAGEWLAVHGVGRDRPVGGADRRRAAAPRSLPWTSTTASSRPPRARVRRSTVNARNTDVIAAVKDATGGGADVALGGLGTASLVYAAIMSLRKGGRLVQVGLTSKEEQGIVGIPLDELIEAELTIVGSVGNPHIHLPALLGLVGEGRLDPAGLVTERVGLERRSERARAHDQLRHHRFQPDRQLLRAAAWRAGQPRGPATRRCARASHAARRSAPAGHAARCAGRRVNSM